MTDPKEKLAAEETRILDTLLKTAKILVKFDLFYVALFNKVTTNLDFPLAVRRVDGKLTRVGKQEERWVSRPCQPEKLLPDILFRNFDQRKPTWFQTQDDLKEWLVGKVGYPTHQYPSSWIAVPLVAKGTLMPSIVQVPTQPALYKTNDLMYKYAYLSLEVAYETHTKFVEYRTRTAVDCHVRTLH